MSLEFKGRTALVTGGSSGIGFEIAKELARGGARLILVASRPDRLGKASETLEAGFQTKPYLISKDLALPDSPGRIFEELNSQKISLDILVNNAGFGVYGRFEKNEAAKALSMIDVNVKAVVSLTRLFLPGMLERRFGRILNVASTAAFQAVPLETLYAATKAFVLSFSEGLAEELTGTGVSVTCLCPGPTETEFFDRGNFRQSRFLRNGMMPPQAVARLGVEALKKQKTLVVAGLRNRLLSFSARLVPRVLATKIARKAVE